MRSSSRTLINSASRRALLATALACGLATAWPAHAEIKGLEILAPAGPGGGYDQLARATQEVLQKHDLASGVQVQNIPGAGGTIGLAQFVTKVLVEVVFTPVTYAIVGWLKRAEHEDYYDRGTRFTPFSLKV